MSCVTDVEVSGVIIAHWLRPRLRVAGGFFFLFQKRRYLFLNTATVHRKRRISNTLSRVENFLKRRFIVFVWMCENGVFQTQLNSCQGSKLARPHIRFKIVTCGCRFFLNRKKRISVFENTWLLVDSQKQFENAAC